MSSVLGETSIRTSRPGLTQANGSRSLVGLRVDERDDERYRFCIAYA